MNGKEETEKCCCRESLDELGREVWLSSRDGCREKVALEGRLFDVDVRNPGRAGNCCMLLMLGLADAG